MFTNITTFILITLSACALQTAVALEIPLEEDRWQVLEFRQIPAHGIAFDQGVMQIQVSGSAGVIMLPLERPGRFSRLHVKARIDGRVDLDGVPQGAEGGDDFRLRVGLVYAGEKTLNFIQRSIAPEWIRRLYALAPEGSGISRVEFFNTWQDPVLEGERREHPTSESWREHFVLPTSETGGIATGVEIPTDADIVAVWISTDGDDTGSSFRVSIERLALDPA
jgi:hypothetical protein